ncbi:hypothetical protein D3C80_1778630 [compost metagenome]
MTKSIVTHFKDLGNDPVDLQELINIEGLCESLAYSRTSKNGCWSIGYLLKNTLLIMTISLISLKG